MGAKVVLAAWLAVASPAVAEGLAHEPPAPAAAAALGAPGGPEGGQGTSAAAVRRIVEQLRTYPARPSAAEVQSKRRRRLAWHSAARAT